MRSTASGASRSRTRPPRSRSPRYPPRRRDRDPLLGRGEGIALANDTRYGLSAGVWTADIGRAVRASRRIRAGTVWINAFGSIRSEVPFRGFGESGLGRELGAHALSAYTELKSVFVAT